MNIRLIKLKEQPQLKNDETSNAYEGGEISMQV
jgi:hypothetical protein